MRKGHSTHRSAKRWLTVSLLVPKGFEDPISNFLVEQGAKGAEEVDEGLNWTRLKTYFPQDGSEKRAIRSLRRYLRSLRIIHPEISSIRIETTSVPDQDWGQNWKRFFKPFQVTSRVVIKPPWSSFRLKKGQISIDITPGMAFGTGTHATTKLCIRALERYLKRKQVSVLDVGTGSGILSIVAARLGAGEVLGLDTDGVAVAMAKENVKQNRVSDTVKISRGSIGNARKKFDVVVANIDLKRLRKMRCPLLHHLRSSGFLILSGILEGEEVRISQYYTETGLLRWAKASQEEEWVCLTFQKK
jgi:ribosomal protein L11 methyltransferase